MRWVLVVVAVLAAAGAGVFVIGSSLPQDHTASRSAVIPAPPEAVWSAITSVAEYPAWRRDLDSVSVIESPDGRLRWREIDGGDKLSYEAEKMEAPANFVARITDTGIPFGGRWTYRIVPDAAGSRITITENGEVYNPVFRFVSRYLMGHTATLDKYLTDLSRKFGTTYTLGTNEYGRA